MTALIVMSRLHSSSWNLFVLFLYFQSFTTSCCCTRQYAKAVCISPWMPWSCSCGAIARRNAEEEVEEERWRITKACQRRRGS